jgi:uncharacterized protein (DUF2141 family)
VNIPALYTSPGMKVNSRLLFFLLTHLLLLSCAKTTTPTGGPKDTIPPTLIYSFPKHNELNYHGDKIELTFDEFINLDNPQEKILITPDVGKNFEARVKKKKVTITFEEKLKDTVTYSINFQESVKDITEKNPAENLKLAFSTGSFIDSLSINGKLFDPLTGKEVKGATVALYQSDTFSIFRNRPSYISKTNDKGLYSIENLKHGEYFLYAFNDLNRNLVVDSRNEGYAFQNASIELHANTQADPLHFFRLDSRPIKMTSARPYNTYFNIKFSKALKNYLLSSSTSDSIYSILGDDKASIKIYKTFSQDSLPVRLQAFDSLMQRIDTTLYVKTTQTKSTPEPFDITLSNWRVLMEKGKIEGIITYTKPLARINYDSMYYRIDSANVIAFRPENLTINHAKKEIRLSKSFDKKIIQKSTASTQRGAAEPKLNQPKTEPPNPQERKPQQPRPDRSKSQDKSETKQEIQDNQLYFGKATFISIESDSSATKSEIVKPIALDETGIIRISIKTNQPFYIVELLDTKFQVIDRIRNKSAISFEDLKPSDYLVRLIIDNNNDGAWNPGNIFRSEATEQIIFYMNEKKSPTINLRANFEIGPLLINY